MANQDDDSAWRSKLKNAQSQGPSSDSSSANTDNPAFGTANPYDPTGELGITDIPGTRPQSNNGTTGLGEENSRAAPLVTGTATNNSAPQSDMSGSPQPKIDFGGMPDLSGRNEGDQWSVTRPDGQVVHYRIPEGNGNRSVDISVVGADGGLLGSMRTAMNEQGGGFQSWVDVTGRPSAYLGQETSYSNPFAGVYNQGTSTTGAPDSTKAYSPDFGQAFPLTENGEIVGELGVVPSQFGFPDVYENVYWDKNGNTTFWQNRSTEFGGMTSWQEGQRNSDGSGWHILPTGTAGTPERWEITPDSPLWNRTEEVPGFGVHIQTLNPETGAYSDRFTSEISPELGYTTFRDPRGVVTRVGDDGSVIIVDREGNILGQRAAPERPDTRSNWEKVWDYAGNSAEAFVDGTRSLLWMNTDTYGDPTLSSREARTQNLQEAWAGLVGMSLGLSAGLALMAIDGYDNTFGGGLNDDAAYTSTDNTLGTLNMLSQLTIGVDWENLDDQPGQTISDALLGGALFFAPKLPRALGGGTTPNLPAGIRDWGNNLGAGAGPHPLPAGYPGGRSPWTEPNRGFDMRNNGDGMSASPGGTPRHSPDQQSPNAPAGEASRDSNRAPDDPGPPPLPAGAFDHHPVPTDTSPSVFQEPLFGSDGQPLAHQSEFAIPWNGDPQKTPPNYWPVGVKERKGDRRWYDSDGSVKMAPWAKKSNGDDRPRPPRAEQDALESATPPRRDGMADNRTNWVDRIDADPNVRSFVGEMLTRQKLEELQRADFVGGGEKASIPVPDGGELKFKPDAIVIEEGTGRIVLVETKFNEAGYQPNQFDAYSYYAEGGKRLDIGDNNWLRKEFLARELNPDDLIVDRVETVRWDDNWAPTDELLMGAADNLDLLGDPMRGSLSKPEWRDSAMKAFSELNAEAGRRALESGDYPAAARYELRSRAVELALTLSPGLESLLKALSAPPSGPVRPVSAPIDQGKGAWQDLGEVITRDARALGSLMVPTFQSGPSFWATGLRGHPSDRSLTVNISSSEVRLGRSIAAEERRALTYNVGR